MIGITPTGYRLGESQRIVGKSSPMQEIFAVIEKISNAATLPVLISGPTGVGKELIAKAIHLSSVRKDSPFIAQNCAAFHENLLEAELFGHSRGAFTGAWRDRQGIFEAADGGTLFLDEVSEMSPSLQAKVLRVLQEGTFLPLGSTTEKRINIRVLAATNRDLAEQVALGNFREDLYYRLNALIVNVPPLSSRREDIPLLVEYFMERREPKFRKVLSEETQQCLLDYSWRGNVRELRNEIERMSVLYQSVEVIESTFLSAHIRQEVEARRSIIKRGDRPLRDAIEVVEKEIIRTTLERMRWNKSACAKELGISRSTLIERVRYYGFEKVERSS